MIQFQLKSLLGSRLLTQRWLSDVTGIRPTTISNICNNHLSMLPVSVIARICEALTCQPGDWIAWSPDPAQESPEK